MLPTKLNDITVTKNRTKTEQKQNM